MSHWQQAVAVILAWGFLLPATSESWGQPARPLDLVVELDVSGSMKRNDPSGLMGEAVGHFVKQLRSEDAVALILFGAQPKVVQQLAPLSEGGRKEALLAQVSRLLYDDRYTNIAAAIERGLYELRSRGRPGTDQAILFATDGIMDTGSGVRDEEQKRWLREQLVPEARQRGVKIFSIAFTDQADFTLLQEMARATGGEYFRASAAQEIGGIFHQISAVLRKEPQAPEAKRPAPSSPQPRKEGLPWAGIGGALIALLAVSLLAWLYLRPRPVAAGRGARTVALGPEAGASVPARPGELLDLETRNVIALDKAVTRIGREADNDVVIRVPTVSSHHAQIEYRQGQFHLRDLRSTNGTFVNKEKIEGEVLLKSGDIVRFDEFRYTFMGPEPMHGGTMMRAALPPDALGRSGRQKTLSLEADALKEAQRDKESEK